MYCLETRRVLICSSNCCVVARFLAKRRRPEVSLSNLCMASEEAMAECNEREGRGRRERRMGRKRREGGKRGEEEEEREERERGGAHCGVFSSCVLFQE